MTQYPGIRPEIASKRLRGMVTLLSQLREEATFWTPQQRLQLFDTERALKVFAMIAERKAGDHDYQ